MFEGVPQAVPDSNLLNQVALRAGKRGIGRQLSEAVSWFAKALNVNDRTLRSLGLGYGRRLVRSRE